MTTIHELKTWPVYFQAIWTGKKTFELRKNDRGFRTGDLLKLREYDPATGGYSGRAILATVGFMVQGEWSLEADTCAMSLLEPSRVIE